MNEQIRKVEIGNETFDTIVGVSIFRVNAEGKKEVLLVQGPSGLWYFPGGKIRKGENMKAGLKRELKEELGIDYTGSFGNFFVDSYEIKGKQLAIANVTALDSLPSEPQLQKGDAVKGFVWTEDPLSFDLTGQARQILESKMGGISTLPKSKKMKNINHDELKNRVSAKISVIKSMMSSWGRNDNEFKILDQMVEDVKSGIMTPEEAEKKAIGLIETKQDYN